MTEKRKHKEPSFGRYTFLVLWGLIAFLSTVIQLWVWDGFVTILPHILPVEILQSEMTTVLLNMIMVGIGGGLAGGAQQVVIYQYWGYIIRQWWWVTALGYALTSFMTFILLYAFDVSANPVENGFLINIASSIVLGAILVALQVILLQKYFDQVWWYVVSFIVSAFVINALMPPNAILSSMISGLIAGATLLWMDYISQKTNG